MNNNSLNQKPSNNSNSQPTKRKNIPVKSIELNIRSIYSMSGYALNLKVTVLPKNATNKKVIWTSSNKSNVRVNNNGVVTTKGDGEAVITATTEDGNLTATCNVRAISNKTMMSHFKYKGNKTDGFKITGLKKDNLPYYLLIPKCVTSIESFAFNDSSIKAVIIHDKVTSIGPGAFGSCPLLEYFATPYNRNPKYRAIDGNLYSADGKILIQYAPGKKAKTFTIPDGVTKIADFAFSDCQNLETIVIPKSAVSIGSCPIIHCTSLTNIVVDENNPMYKSIDGNLYSRDGSKLISYAIGKKDTSFDIPNSVTSIGAYAFSCCISLTSVNIPNSVTSIGCGAFRSCTSLTSILVPDNVKTIETGTFNECFNLNSVTLGKNVMSIGNKAFSQCVSLTSINIPNSVASIGDEAFNECMLLKSINIPDNIKIIGIEAFYSCISLQSLTLPDKPILIADKAFVGCAHLESVTIGKHVSFTGESIFSLCTSLTSFTIDEENHKYKAIDGNLYSADGKTLIQYALGKKETVFGIPSGVTKIQSGAFGCTKLKSIYIPRSVVSIGILAFFKCSSLTDVYYSGSKEEWDSITFESEFSDPTNDGATIHFNSETYQA